MKFSAHQEAVFKFVEKGKGNGLCIAVAGGGKTTTAIEAMKRMTGKRCMLAFNKKIVKATVEKLDALGLGFNQGYQANTVNALGSRIWKRSAPNVKLLTKRWEKTGNIFRALLPQLDKSIQSEGDLKTEYSLYAPVTLKLVDLARLRAFGIQKQIKDTKNWYDIVDHFDLQEEFADTNGDLPPNTGELVATSIRYAQAVLSESIKQSKEFIDYIDQVYMPVQANVFCKWFDWLIVDECQDTSPIFRCFYRLVMKPSARALFVGDPFQAINGFAGADNDAMDIIAREFNTIELPLTVSYRCPKAVVALAQSAGVTHIQSAPNAPEGHVSTISEGVFHRDHIKGLKPTDAIICRNTAPLAELFFILAKAGIPAKIEGKNIGEGLITLVDKWKSVKTLDAYKNKLQDYCDKQVKRYMTKGHEDKAERIQDQTECILAIAHAVKTLDELKNMINTMFGDSEYEPTPKVTLSTCHKSKGLEWSTVYWLGPNRYQPSPFARQTWQQEQERNLIYVAITRSMDTLYTIQVPIPDRRIKGF